MGIVIRLDKLMAHSKMTVNELAAKLGMTNVSISNLKTGKMKYIRFETMNKICCIFDCQPGDIFEYLPDELSE